jgi:hypothetical protein
MIVPDAWRARAAAIDRFTLHTGRLIVTTGLVLLAAYLAAAMILRKPDGRIVIGDATHHFVQLRSLVFDRDLDFRNEYVRLYGLRGEEPGTEWIFTELTATGHVRNYMPIGPALLWAPLYLAIAGGQWLLSLAGLAPAPDGFGRSLQLVPGVMGITAATGAAWLSWRMARTRTAASAATIGVFGVWLGSHALYYTLVSPSYSHAPSMLTSAIFFAAWLRWRERLDLRRLPGLGALAGLCALMRWQDAIFIAVPCLETMRWRAPIGRRLAGAVLVAAGFFAAFSPQMAVWTVLYGRPLAMPQGPSFMQWTAPHLIDVLFSDNHGLFTWAPMLVPALLGVLAIVRRERALALPVAIVVIASWYANGAVADWWAGEAFGARRFLSLFPLFALGLSAWLDPGGKGRLPPVRLVVVAILLMANGLLLLQYELFMKGLRTIAPYPHGWLDMWLTRFVVPFRLLGRWLS